MDVKIKTVDNGKLPVFKTSGAACADCFARTEDVFFVNPGETIKIPLGFALELPSGYEAQIRPRSGLSAKGIICGFGTVDEDYRGEVCAILSNNTKDDFLVRDGDRIAQVAIRKTESVTFVLSESLSDTERGDKGFGSTGV